MRVLMTSNPMSGHALPLVPLGTELMRAGHEVVWATSEDGHATLVGLGFTVRRAGTPHATLRKAFGQRHPEYAQASGRTAGDIVFPDYFGCLAGPAALADLTSIIEDVRPHALVHELAELAGPLLATRYGIPKITHGIGPAYPTRRIGGAADGMAPLWRQAGLDPRPWGGVYDPVHLDIYPPSLRPSWAAEYPATTPLRPIPFGEEASDDMSGLIPPGGQPFVYVTFGTVFGTGGPAFRSILNALSSIDVRVLATIGTRGDASMFQDLPANVRVEQFVPQGLVLRHATLVVSHGGSGTSLGALSYGVPQLVIPQGADQFINADQITAAGAGLTLEPDEADERRIADAASAILSSASFASSARRVGDEIEAMPAPSAIAAAFDTLVEAAAAGPSDDL